jgi:hypothetical protein
MFNHILVVSRTAMPLNFVAMRQYAPGQGENEKSNNELINWVIVQLRILKEDGSIPRPEQDRIWIPSFEVISQYNDKMLEITERVGTKDIARAEMVGKNSRGVFISYISKYSEKHPSWKPELFWSVERVANQIKKSMGYEALFYPPGVLSSEFLTEQRRWQIVCYIDRQIRLQKEFWIIETSDYYDSWWTQAEVAELMYLKQTHPEKMPKVRLFNPASGDVRDASDDFIGALTERLEREMARYHSNSDALTMGIESAKVMMQIRKLPKSMQRRYCEEVMELKKRNLFGKGSLMAQSLENTQIEEFLESINSHVYEESFWNDRIITCPHCQGKNERKNHFDFYSFLTLNGNGYFRISEKEMNAIVERGYWVCPNTNCCTKYYIERQRYEQFIWWPVRMTSATGPNGVFVERQTTYSLLPDVNAVGQFGK